MDTSVHALPLLLDYSMFCHGYFTVYVAHGTTIFLYDLFQHETQNNCIKINGYFQEL